MHANHHHNGPAQPRSPREASNGQEIKAKKAAGSPAQKKANQPSLPNEPGKLSSDETSQKRVVFQLGAPTARNVSLAADFTDWEKQPIAMSKEGNGIWRATVALKQGRHRYKFLVDGEWFDDPNCGNRIPNAYGTTDAVIEVS